ADQDPKSLILVIADMARSNPPLGSAFVAELARQLQGRGPALALPLTWIEQRLSESSLTIAQLVQAENQQQAANQVSISNNAAGNGRASSHIAIGPTDFILVRQTSLLAITTLVAQNNVAITTSGPALTRQLSAKGRWTDIGLLVGRPFDGP
ncbi:MAG: hypothetical protein PHY45_14225, partial [Rhodocyclaceae bacterium]|nr:hypothetical protein [Rhodocyclaceae bacterium]